MFIKLQKLFLFITILSFDFINPATLILSDPENKNQSFTFPVGPHAIYIPHGRFFVGATQEVEDNNFALSYGIRPPSEFSVVPPAKTAQENIFKPIAPTIVKLNNEKDKKNPLHGAAISNLVMIDQRLLVNKENEAKFYVVDDILNMSENIINVFSSPEINNAQEQVASKILSITSSAPYLQENPEPILQDRIAFAALQQESGISLGLTAAVFKYTKTDESLTFQFNMINSETGQIDENKAKNIDLHTQQLAIEDPLTLLKDAVDIYFERSLNRLYVAVGAQGGPRVGNGAFGIMAVSGVLQGEHGDEVGALNFIPIVTKNAITGHNKIVGGRGPNTQVQIFKVRAMVTTTHLNYLIVVGGNGFNTQNQVYALPLVNNIASAAHGTLANVHQIPTDLFVNGTPQSFITRTYLHPATGPDEIYSNTDVPAIVGAGVASSSITDIQVVNDTVFVSVASDGQNQRAGIFYSQAIFDEFGRIKAWTPWNRATGQPKETFGFAYDSSLGTVWYIPTLAQMQDVFRTNWSKGQTDIEKIASQEFSPENNGVLGLIDFPLNTPSFTTTISERFSFISLTGLNKIVLIQTGKDNDVGIFGPTDINLEIVRFDSKNGSLEGYPGQSSMITISHGALSRLGCINSATIVNDAQNGWLVVGGSDGVAILMNTNGSGWAADPGLSKNFQGLQDTMFFKKIINLKDIKKLIGFDNFLFILTSSSLYRTKVTPDAIANDNLILEKLTATSRNKFSSFSDLIVSPPIALIAASSGLFISSKGSILSDDPSLIQWKMVEMPESAGSFCGSGPATRFWPISLGSIEDIKNGNLWVLNSYIGLNQGQIYRYTLRSNSQTSIILFPDLFVKDKRTFFVNLEDYRNYVATDGAIIGVSRSAYAGQSPKLFLLSHTLKSGQRFGGRNVVNLQLGLQDFCTIGSMIKVSASGSWLVHGDFGLRINE